LFKNSANSASTLNATTSVLGFFCDIIILVVDRYGSACCYIKFIATAVSSQARFNNIQRNPYNPD
jgi:hypothetical protein